MIKRLTEEQLQCVLTVCQVRDILNKYQVPFNEHALNAMVRAAKKQYVKIALTKSWQCIKFAAYMIGDAIKKAVFGNPKYSKGGAKRGRKDM